MTGLLISSRERSLGWSISLARTISFSSGRPQVLRRGQWQEQQAERQPAQSKRCVSLSQEFEALAWVDVAPFALGQEYSGCTRYLTLWVLRRPEQRPLEMHHMDRTVKGQQPREQNNMSLPCLAISSRQWVYSRAALMFTCLAGYVRGRAHWKASWNSRGIGGVLSMVSDMGDACLVGGLDGVGWTASAKRPEVTSSTSCEAILHGG